jgi:hypothetical protein
MREISIYEVTIHSPTWSDWTCFFVGVPTQDKLIATFEFQRDRLLSQMEHGPTENMPRVFDSQEIKQRCANLSRLVRTCSMPDADSTARTCITSRRFLQDEITIVKLEAIQL